MITDILPKLEKVKKGRGQGQWLACCPAHMDKSPSLALKELHNGQILMNCLAGCDTRDIVNAIGLDMRSLYPPEPEPLQGRNAKSVMPSWRRKQFIAFINSERLIAKIFRADIRANRFKVTDLDRFFLACERIRKAEGVLHG